MDGQNFENENNVTVDTTATEVSSTAEPAQETPAAEQPANNYQDYTTNVQPQVAVTTPVQPENKRYQCAGYHQSGTGYSFYCSRMLYRMDWCFVWYRWYYLCSICQ